MGRAARGCPACPGRGRGSDPGSGRAAAAARCRSTRGQDDSLAGLQGVHEKRPGLNLFGESRGVEQDRAGLGDSREAGRRAGPEQTPGPLVRRGPRARISDLAERRSVFLEVGCSGNGLIHQGLVQWRSGAVSIRQKNKPVTAPAREAGTGQSNLHRNAVEVLLRTRSSGGSLRPSRDRSFKRPISAPYGFHLVRQKYRPVSNMAEAESGRKPDTFILALGQAA